MSDASKNPNESRPRFPHEYEDPHYHDEELDIQQDEFHREGKPPVKHTPPRKLPPPKRRHYED
jgi:hypothetical protein